MVSTPRYEEVAHYRHELEDAKRENEMLKQRIRDLERQIKGDADGQRGRQGAPAQSNVTGSDEAAFKDVGSGSASQ